jgi:transcriptional regulator with XRE-family HTH domain
MAEGTPKRATGLAIRQLRTASGLTIEALANRAGVAPSYLSRVENGLVAPTSSWVHTVVTAIGEHIEAA